MKRFQDNVAVKQTNAWMNGERNKDSKEKEKKKEWKGGERGKREWNGDRGRLLLFDMYEWVRDFIFYIWFREDKKTLLADCDYRIH